MQIREATAADWPAIWPFFRRIVEAGETYAYDPEMDEAEAGAMWMVGPPGRTVVALDDAGTVIGSASFMVDPEHSGRGVGRALGEHVLGWARSEGYRGMQFNAVVETNAAAVALWRSLGFEVIGTVPGTFDHPTEGYVGLIVLFRRL